MVAGISIGMMFATKVSENWKQEIGKLGGQVIVDVDLGKIENFEEALKSIMQQTIASCRPDWIGGEYLGSEVDRIECMEKGIRAGADFVEVEWDMLPQYRDALLNIVRKAGCAVIVSNYYQKVPSKREVDLLMAEIGEKADVVKIGVQVGTYRACLDLLKRVEGNNVVLSGSGQKGELLDALSALCGFYFGFVPIGKLGKAKRIKIKRLDIKGLRKVEEEMK